MKQTIRFFAIVSMLSACGIVTAQDSGSAVSSDEIVNALDPPKTRSLTRGIGVQARKQVDLNIPFEYNSSDLAPEAMAQLEELSKALARDSLSKFRFEIAGHTDASGSAEYNRDLSERRAETVRNFLIDRGLSPERIESVGHGEDQPLLPQDPQDPDNRRVEIRNLGESG